jgi:acetolactate synthase-1/3 small subunit
MEACLLKISTEGLLQNPAASKAVRHHGARIVEVNPTFSIVEKKGLTEDILSLFEALNEMGIVRQFVRSGRIAVTRDCIEHLDQYLEQRELNK